MNELEKRIDTQAYFGYNKELYVNQNPEEFRTLRDNLRKSGYEVRFLLMPYSAEENNKLPFYISNNPGLFIGGYPQINPNKGYQKYIRYSTPEEIKSLIETDTIVGLKFHTSVTQCRVDDERLNPFAEVAIAYDIPLLFHCAASGQDFTRVEYFKKLKSRYPELKIICAHMGGLNEKYIPSYVRFVQEHDDVYLNTSGLTGYKKRWMLVKDGSRDSFCYHFENTPLRWVQPYLDNIEDIQDKVIFGSDHPEVPFDFYPVDLAEPSIVRKVTYDNPIKALNLKERIKGRFVA